MPKERLKFTGPKELTFEEADILYDIVIDKKPIKVVEFPTFGGLSTLYIAEALKDLQGGTIYSFDYYDRGIEPRAIEVLNDNQISEYTGLIKVDDLKDLIGQLKSTVGNADIVFFDSLHSDLDKVFKGIWDNLQEGSTIILHDVECEVTDEMKTPSVFKNIVSKLEHNEFKILTTFDSSNNKNSFGIFTVPKNKDLKIKKTKAIKTTNTASKRLKKAAKKVQKEQGTE